MEHIRALLDILCETGVLPIAEGIAYEEMRPLPKEDPLDPRHLTGVVGKKGKRYWTRWSGGPIRPEFNNNGRWTREAVIPFYRNRSLVDWRRSQVNRDPRGRDAVIIRYNMEGSTNH